MSILNSWWRTLSGVLFPPSCPVCGAALESPEQLLCTHCMLLAPLTGFWNEVCNPITTRFESEVPIEHGSALLFFVEGGGWQRMIHGFKYHNRRIWARRLGRWYGKLLRESGLYGEVDCIVPMPLHPLKLLWRGYNQAEQLADGIAEELGVPVDRRSVVRTRYTPSQARKPHRERAANVEGAFAVRRAEALRGKHLLLVDDVLTTGSTLIACIEAITAAVPDARISIAALATTRRGVGVAD